MEITTSEHDQIKVVAVAGSVDALTANDFLAALQREIDQGNIQLVADLGQLDYASSAGLRAILATLKETRRQGGDLRLAAVQKGVHKVLDLSGFTSILKIYPDVEAAVVSFAQDS